MRINKIKIGVSFFVILIIVVVFSFNNTKSFTDKRYIDGCEYQLFTFDNNVHSGSCRKCIDRDERRHREIISALGDIEKAIKLSSKTK